MIDSPVFAENPRTYLVHVDGQLQQVPKHSATLLEEAIKNDNSVSTLTS